jgi:hypothetical protein
LNAKRSSTIGERRISARFVLPETGDGAQLGFPVARDRARAGCSNHSSAGAETGPVVASATGAGQVHVGPGGEFLRTFSVTAREYADGTDKGQGQIQNRFGPFGPIHINDPTLGIPEDSKVFFAVQDNGEGPASPPDMLSFVLFTGEPTGPTCEEILDLAFAFAVEDGNIQVRSG